MTVFLAISLHSAASFQAIPSAGWGVEYFVLVPKLGPSIIVISLVSENEIKIRFTEEMETLAAYFTEDLLSTVFLQRKEAYILQNCTGRKVGEKPLGVTPVKLTSLFAFGVIVGSCETYEFKSACERADIKIAGGATAEMVFPLMSWGKQFILPSILKKSCEQRLRFLTHKPNTVILVTSNEESQVINVAAGGVLETQRLTSPSIIHVKASEQIMLYVDYEYPCVKEEDVHFQELVMVVPMHLFMNEYTWSTPSARGYTPAHYISIVAPIDNFFIDIDKRQVSLRWKRDSINRWQTAFSRLEPGTHYISSLTGVPFGMYVVGLTPDYQFIHIAGFHVALDNQESCEKTAARYNDGLDNDCDGLIDEERENLKDDDHDDEVDEDMASYATINVTGLSLPLPLPVPPFVVGYLPPECPCPSISSCQMEMCQELNSYIVCLESIVTQTNCDIKTRMEAMRKLRLREIKNSSLSSCISQCPTFLHSCIPPGANTEAKMSCRQYASYLGCLKAVSNNPSCSRSFQLEAIRWIIVTENLEIKNLCLQEVSALESKNVSDLRNPSDGVPEGWHKITGKCIKLIEERKQYAVAADACSKMESQLLTIMNGDETTEVNNYLTNREENNTTYIGLKKVGAQWQWDSDDTNSTILYADWAGEASNDSLNVCVIKDKSLDFKWRAVPCSSDHGFICQKSCGAEPLSKSYIYQIRDKFYIANAGSPALRTLINLVSEREKLQIFKGRCPTDPNACSVTGLDKCINVHTQFDCFQEILRNRGCSKKLKALSVVMLTSLLNECYPPQEGGTTIPTDTTIPDGQTDFPINLYTTSEEIFKITASLSTRDPVSPSTEQTTVSLSPGAYCDDLFKRCEPTSAERIAWCQNVDIHWNCMKGLLNTKVCSPDARQRASDWMIENGRPQHCPPTTTTDIPDPIVGIEDLICGPAPKCGDSGVNSESICEENSAGRAHLKCLNEIIDRDFCFPKEAESSKTARMSVIDNMLEFNCEGLNDDLVQFVQFEPDCEQCITLGRSTLFFYYELNTTLNANGQCNKLYFDYCNGDENECDKISSWDTACTFVSDCSDLKTDPNLRTHPIEAMCNVWEDEDTAKRLIVTIPTYLFRSVNYRYRARLSSDFSASNKSAIFGVSKAFIVKNLIDENKARVEPRSTNGADIPHAQGTNMGVEFQVQFPYMPEGQPILMMYSTMINTFDVYVTAPFSDHPVFEKVRITRLQVSYYVVQRQHLISRSDTTTSIVAKGKQKFGMTVFMPVSVHSAASFLAIPTTDWGLEYYVLVPKKGPSIVLISLVEEKEISVRFTERMEQLESLFTEPLLSTLIVNRKQAYIMQNCTGRTVGEQPLGVTPVKITAQYSFGVIVGTCEQYEFESKCRRTGVKIAGGVTAEMILPARTWGRHFIVPQTLKKSCNQNLRFLTLEENTIIRITAGEQTQVVNVADGGALETYRMTSQSIVFVKASSRIMMYTDYYYPCNTEENINFQELVVVVPAEVFMNEYIWSTPLARGHTPSHYISVVAPIDNFFLEIDTIKVSLRWKKDLINRWQTSFSRLAPGTHYISSVTGVPFGIYVVGLTQEYQFFHSAGFFISDFSGLCEKTTNRYNDGVDNDCDGFIDEERENIKDDDHDGDDDEDLSSYTRTNLEGISLPLPPQVPPFVTGFLPQDCPCPEIQNCEMEMCTDLTNYVVCLESIVTLTSCFIQTRMEAMRKLRLKEIKTSSQSHCLKKCPSFLHACIPSDVTEGDTMSCSQLQIYLNCLKAVTTNPSCSRSFREEAGRWITSTDNLNGKALCFEGMTTASPEDWQEVAGICLKMNKAGKQHHEAVTACSNMNSELATIMDDNENLGASAALTTAGVDSAYIALTYINGQWSWPSGLQNTYRNWRDGHVDDPDKNCTTIDKSVGFKWVAVSCNTSHSYMCKKPSCDARPLTKSYPGLPMLRNVKEEEKDPAVLELKGKCPYYPSSCLHLDVIDICLTFHDQIDCFQEFFKHRHCTNAYKANYLRKFTHLLSSCIPLPPGGTTLPTESTLPEGHTDFPMDVSVTTRQYETATESISTRDPGLSASLAMEVRTSSMAPGANCEDMYRVCLPKDNDRLTWCQKVDNHWNCMKGLINTLTCTEEIRNMASQWLIENGRPLHCPPTTPTAMPQVILEIDETICGMAPTCVDQPHYDSVCEENSDGRVHLQCLNEVIDKDYCFPREAKSAKLGRMAIVDKMLEFNCEGLEHDGLNLLKFEPDCEQCITLGMTTIFFYYELQVELNANDQCYSLYFDYCNGDENECQKLEGWATGCTFVSNCESGFVSYYELRTHPLEAFCNVWQDENYDNHLVVSVPTKTFKSVNFRFRTRLSSDFSASNKSAMYRVSKAFVVKKLVDEGRAMVQLPSTNGAEGQHGWSIFWYIVVAALNVAALVTGV